MMTKRQQLSFELSLSSQVTHGTSSRTIVENVMAASLRIGYSVIGVDACIGTGSCDTQALAFI